MDCSLPGSSVHGIFQARILEWVAISFSRGSSQLRDWTLVSCIGGRRFPIWATREAALIASLYYLRKKANLWESVKDRGTWHAAVHGITEIRLRDWTTELRCWRWAWVADSPRHVQSAFVDWNIGFSNLLWALSFPCLQQFFSVHCVSCFFFF